MFTQKGAAGNLRNDNKHCYEYSQKYIGFCSLILLDSVVSSEFFIFSEKILEPPRYRISIIYNSDNFHIQINFMDTLPFHRIQ